MRLISIRVRKQRDELYCGEGKDHYNADKFDYVSSSCEVKDPPLTSEPCFIRTSENTPSTQFREQQGTSA
jgi:hypothetical protein